MRLRRAHDGRVKHAGKLDVVYVGGPAGDQPRVLLAPELLADEAVAAAGSSAALMLSLRVGLPASAVLGRSRPALARGRQDRLDDVVVAGAAAEVALEPVADLLLR